MCPGDEEPRRFDLEGRFAARDGDDDLPQRLVDRRNQQHEIVSTVEVPVEAVRPLDGRPHVREVSVRPIRPELHVDHARGGQGELGRARPIEAAPGARLVAPEPKRQPLLARMELAEVEEVVGAVAVGVEGEGGPDGIA